MNRLRFVLLLALLLALVPFGPSQAQRGGRGGNVCPFLSQAQFNVQMNWQNQQRQNAERQQVLNNQRQQFQNQARGNTNYPNHQRTPGRNNPGRTTLHLQRVNNQRESNTRQIVTHRTTSMHQTTIHRTTHLIKQLNDQRNSIHLTHGRGLIPHTRTATSLHLQTHRSTSTHLSTTTRTQTHRAIQLQRITTQRTTTASARTAIHRPGTAQPPRFTSTRQPNTNQQRTSQSRLQNTKQTRTATTRENQHRPSVQVRVNMNMKCGSCHQCQANTPMLVSKPNPGQPFLTQIPRPGISMPLQQPIRRPDLLVRPNPNPGPMVQLPRRPLAPIPVLLPPALPNLALVAQPRPLPGLLVQAPRDTLVRIPKMDRPSSGTARIERGTPDSPSQMVQTLPSLPPLLEGKAVLDPLPLPSLEQIQDSGRSATHPGVRMTHSLLQPEQIDTAPKLAPLPGRLPLGLGLLPKRDSREQEMTPPAKLLPLELVFLPPTLPPLPDLAQR